MDNSRSMVEMHSSICEDIAGNSTNISPKRNAGSSSLPGGAKNAVISMDCGVFLLEVQPAKTDQEENYDCINSEIAS